MALLHGALPQGSSQGLNRGHTNAFAADIPSRARLPRKARARLPRKGPRKAHRATSSTGAHVFFSIRYSNIYIYIYIYIITYISVFSGSSNLIMGGFN